MEPVTERHWVPRNDDPDHASLTEFCRELELSRLAARLLLERGFTLDTAKSFLSPRLADLPDPDLLPDMKIAVDRLVNALRDGEKIAVHGDYDVDGITGTVLLTAVLKEFGATDVEYHIPLRLKDGYGLSADAIREEASRGALVMISVDCGVSAHDEAKLAKELGIDLIVTDHHQPPPRLPQALAVINPQRADSGFPFKSLSGVGVAFFLLVALRKKLREIGWFTGRPEPDLRCYLDLVALGTIADLVPLQDVNRTLTRHGLTLLERGSRVGVQALKQVSAVKTMNCGVVGFQLAPRLNAAGRMEDAVLGVELLLEEDLVLALNAARYLDKCNRDRQALEKQTLDEALLAVEKLEDEKATIVLSRDGWHPGVIGIVASRLVERYHRPTVMIAMDGQAGKGSCRSIQGYHLYDGLQECVGHLVTFGGHEMAAGLSLTDEQVEAFAEAFETVARQKLSREDLAPRLRHDGTVLLEEIDLATVRQIEDMAPFGMGNPEPLFVVEGVRAMKIQTVGENHLRFTACQGGYSHPAIAFGMLGRRDQFSGELDLLVSPQVNRFRGQETVQLRVKDVRPTSL